MNFSSAIYRWSQIVTGYNTMKETLVVKLLLCNLINYRFRIPKIILQIQSENMQDYSEKRTFITLITHCCLLEDIEVFDKFFAFDLTLPLDVYPAGLVNCRSAAS